MAKDFDKSNMKKLYEKAINMYGAEMQAMVSIEEMAELQKALIKHVRAGKYLSDREKERVNVCEEIADVKIMMAQLEMIYGEEDVALFVSRKMKRLAGNVGVRMGIEKWQDGNKGVISV